LIHFYKRKKFKFKMLLWSLVGCLLVSRLVSAAGGICAGCPSSVTELSEDHEAVVNFALLQLAGEEGSCTKELVKVENFSQQVVAGLLYRFDLVLKHDNDNPEECAGPGSGEEERCHMQVWEQKWRDPPKTINWDKVNCTRGFEKEDSVVQRSDDKIPVELARVPLTKNEIVKESPIFPQLRVGLVNLGQSGLLGEGDQEYVNHGSKPVGKGDQDFIERSKKIFGGDHDYKQHGKPVLGGGDHDYKPHGKTLLGSDDHDLKFHSKLLGGGNHDYKSHGKDLLGKDDHDKKLHKKKLGGGGDHGPIFAEGYTKKEILSERKSQKALNELQSLDSFHNFMEEHQKVYNTREEYKERYGIFRENMKKVQFLHETEQGTGEYGATAAADLTEMEFKKTFLGWNTKDDPEIHWPAAEIPDVELPKEFDWRQKNAVTEVKNQGQCGSCWAFSVTGNVEGQYAVKHGELLDLSEQELVDCDKRDNGCNGGLPENAYKTLIEIGGLETEADYGYDGKDEACQFNRSRVAARVSGGVEISQNETEMAQWLLKNGPISVGLNAAAMQFYRGGVSHPWKFLCSPDGIDHGVLIVGFGEHEYPLFHKKLPYWTIKNSWGPGWGEEGYYRLYRGDGTCGINMMTSSAVVE